MSHTEELLYTARTHTTGGRQDGMSRSSDGRLDVRLSPPGGAGIGTNPEQLFAAGWSACFEGAMEIAARKRKIVLQAKARSTQKSILSSMREPTRSERASVSACPASIATSRAISSMRRTRPAPIPGPFAATSTSPSI